MRKFSVEVEVEGAWRDFDEIEVHANNKKEARAIAREKALNSVRWKKGIPDKFWVITLEEIEETDE